MTAISKIVASLRHIKKIKTSASLASASIVRNWFVPATCQFSIVSDDCWGGRIYQRLDRAYASPFVGLWVGCDTYLDLIENLSEYLKQELVFEDDQDVSYPIGKLVNARLGFKHYTSQEDAKATFERRRQRFDLSHAFFKVDFRSEWYTLRDVERWNSLQLPNSIAFIDHENARFELPIHNALPLNRPTTSFDKNLEESLAAFCWWTWLNDGEIVPQRGWHTFTHKILGQRTT